MSGFQQLPPRDDCGAQLSRERNPYNHPVAVGASLLGGANSNTSRAPCSSAALHSPAPRRRRLPPSATRSGRGRDRQPPEAWQRYDEWIGDSEAGLTPSALGPEDSEGQNQGACSLLICDET